MLFLRRSAFLFVCAVCGTGGAPARADLADVECSQTSDQPCMVTATSLPLRLLVKPQSNVYIQMDESSGQERSNVPPFEVYYAFEMHDVSYDDNFKASGWFRVGADESKPIGYMRAEDVVPWKQALALAFTNPGPTERKPVLMFASSAALDSTLQEIEAASGRAEQLYQEVLGGDVPAEIVSREGNAWVDIEQTFYLMPILAHEDLSDLRPDVDLKAVQLAALTNQARSQQATACDLHAADATSCIQEQSGKFSSKLGMDAVFVIDMTSSMSPYIEAVRNAVGAAAQALSANFQGTSSQLRLGLVGYRDNMDMSPGIEFVARNFTPQLLEAGAFADLMTSGGASGTIEAAKVGSGDHEEDVFAGLKLAIEDSAWSPDAARVIILIGDASGHAVGHSKNSTGLDERGIRELADQNGVHIATIYVGEEGSADFALARPQFETMAAGDGESSVAFSHVSGSNPAKAGGQSLEISLRDAIDSIISFLNKGDFREIMSGRTDARDRTGQAVLGAVRAAFVDYIGADAQPPSNIIAWALDRDPTDYRKKAFDIKVMVRRKDVEELMDLLAGLMENLKAGMQTSTFVFGNIQQGSTATSYDLGIAETDAISASKKIPEWIKNLPYKSEVLTLTLAEFTNSSPDDRTIFEQRINSLIALYDQVLIQTDVWVAVNEDGPAEEKIYMLDLQNLP